MTEPLQRVLRADHPLTLAGVPGGFLPWLAADLARAAHGTGKSGRAVVIAADEAAMRALADTVPLFAPDVEVLTLPGWDCLPYDRVSPNPELVSQRIATLARLLEPASGPRIVLTTVNALVQRVPPRHVFHGSSRVLKTGGTVKPEEFKALHAYSPYHNLKKGTKYPATMVTTAAEWKRRSAA